jgi:hypothetical protein
MLERWGQSCWGRLLGLRAEVADKTWRAKNAESDNIQLRKQLRMLGGPNPLLWPQPE